MRFDNDDITRLHMLVRERMSSKRYEHTLGVEKMARYLGEIILPDKVDELRVAALMHDVAKEMSFDDHLAILQGSTVEYTDEDLEVKPALHSIAAVPLIMRDFCEFATDDVCSAVANHTLGAPGMSIFDEIIFISDYAEEGRTYYTCIEVREHLLNRVKKENSHEDNIRALHEASYRSTVYTVDALTLRKEKINTRTISTKNYLEEIIYR